MILKYIKAADSCDISGKKGYRVNAGGVDIALFRYKGKLFAFRDSCPHQGAPLSDGSVEERNGSLESS